MAHTPGPWKNSGGYITDATGMEIAGVEWAGSEPEGKSNARLIAAAPELLEALIAAKGTIEYLLANSDNGPAENCIEIIAAAIAKAEGRADEN